MTPIKKELPLVLLPLSINRPSTPHSAPSPSFEGSPKLQEFLRFLKDPAERSKPQCPILRLCTPTPRNKVADTVDGLIK
jgi:hypothetical protein